MLLAVLAVLLSSAALLLRVRAALSLSHLIHHTRHRIDIDHHTFRPLTTHPATPGCRGILHVVEYRTKASRLRHLNRHIDNELIL